MSDISKSFFKTESYEIGGVQVRKLTESKHNFLNGEETTVSYEIDIHGDTIYNVSYNGIRNLHKILTEVLNA